MQSITVVAGNDKQSVLSKIFLNEETFPVTLLAIGLKIVGLGDLQSFRPESIRAEIMDELNIKFMPEHVWDKFMAALTVFNTDVFYQDVFSFNEICGLLSECPTSPDDFQPVDSYEMAWAVTQARMIDPLDGDTDLNFSDEVCAFMGVVLDNEGYLSVPKVLQEAKLPQDSQDNANSWIDEAEYMPAILDNSKNQILDLEQTVRSLTNELQQQLHAVSMVPT